MNGFAAAAVAAVAAAATTIFSKLSKALTPQFSCSTNPELMNAAQECFEPITHEPQIKVAAVSPK